MIQSARYTTVQRAEGGVHVTNNAPRNHQQKQQQQQRRQAQNNQTSALLMTNGSFLADGNNKDELAMDAFLEQVDLENANGNGEIQV